MTTVVRGVEGTRAPGESSTLPSPRPPVSMPPQTQWGRFLVQLSSSPTIKLDHCQVASFLLSFLERNDQSLRLGWSWGWRWQEWTGPSKEQAGPRGASCWVPSNGGRKLPAAARCLDTKGCDEAGAEAGTGLPRPRAGIRNPAGRGCDLPRAKEGLGLNPLPGHRVGAAGSWTLEGAGLGEAGRG